MLLPLLLLTLPFSSRTYCLTGEIRQIKTNDNNKNTTKKRDTFPSGAGKPLRGGFRDSEKKEMEAAVLVWDGLHSFGHSLVQSTNLRGATTALARCHVQQLLAVNVRGMVLPSGGVGYSLGTSAEDTPGCEAGAPGEFTGGTPDPGGDNALAEPRGGAGGTQGKEGVPTLASVLHNSRGCWSQSPLGLLAPGVVATLDGE